MADSAAGPVLLVASPPGKEAERHYVANLVLGEWLGLSWQPDEQAAPAGEWRIRRAGTADTASVTMPDLLLGVPDDAWLSEASLPRPPLARLDGAAVPEPPAGLDSLGLASAAPVPGPIPVLFGSGGVPPWRRAPDGPGLALSLDILGGIFFLVTRYEEVATASRDPHGRIPASASLAAREGFLGRPLADEYADLLWLALATVWPDLRRRPGEYRLRPTHDVDHAFAAYGRPFGVVAHAIAGDVARRRDPILAARRTVSLVASRANRVMADPFDSFETLLGASERHGLTSTFYFMTGGTGHPIDGSYGIEHPKVVRLLRRVHERGHEVGLHGSYGSYRSAEQLRAELNALRAACLRAGFEQESYGIRQHYLRLEPAETWRCQEAAGFEHDSSLGFAEEPGFRAGTGREYPLFDLRERRMLRLRERPLVVMDATLLEYQALPLDVAFERAVAVLDGCRRHGTDAVLLYHNSSLTGPRQRRHYSELVDRVAGGGDAS